MDGIRFANRDGVGSGRAKSSVVQAAHRLAWQTDCASPPRDFPKVRKRAASSARSDQCEGFPHGGAGGLDSRLIFHGVQLLIERFCSDRAIVADFYQCL
jgi:hypothetical protein